jgi:hypothetical protein
MSKCVTCGKSINGGCKRYQWKEKEFICCDNTNCLVGMFHKIQFGIEDYYRKKLVRIQDIIETI